MKELLDVRGGSGTWIGFGPGSLHCRRSNPGEVALRDAEVAQTLEAAQPGELLDIDADPLAESPHRVRRHLFVEAKRLWERQRIHRSVLQSVAPTQSLRHRVPEAEHRAAERHAGVHRTFEQLRASLEVLRRVDDTRQPLADQ